MGVQLVFKDLRKSTFKTEKTETETAVLKPETDPYRTDKKIKDRNRPKTEF